MVGERHGFVIRPHEGVGGVSFGMTATEVESVLGPPSHHVRNYLGERKDIWQGIKACYDKNAGTLVEIQLTRPSEALLLGMDLLRSEDVVQDLMLYDPEPLESLGIVLFLGIGIAVNVAEYAQDEEDKAIGVFARGRWDGLLPRFTVLKP